MLNEVARIYRDEPDKVRQNADVLKDRLKPAAPRHDASAPPSEAMLADLGRALVQAIDPVNGGIRGAPKFPAAAVLRTSCGARHFAMGSPIRSRR